MDKFLVTGGTPLNGTIQVSGAKNSALPCMAAAILTDEEVILENIPQVRDIETERKLLASMGAEVELSSEASCWCTKIRCASLSDPVAKYEIVKTMRASSLVLGPLIARAGVARVGQIEEYRHIVISRTWPTGSHFPGMFSFRAVSVSNPKRGA